MTTYTNITNKGKYVYHYTSFETIFAILHKYQHINEFCLHASNIYKVNDPNEMSIGFEKTKELILKYEDIHHILREKRLSEVYSNETYLKDCINDYLFGKNLNIINHGIIPYIICFSKRRDYLPMWSMYGRQGKGVCLKIDRQRLEECPPHDVCIFSNVYYNSKNRTSVIEHIISKLYSLYQNESSDLTLNKKMHELATIYLAVAPLFKHKDYQYESEYRLISYKPYFGEISAYKPPTNKDIEPFIPISLPIDSLKEIIVGPDANYDVMNDILSLKLKECSLDSIRIKKSRISFIQNK